MAPFTVGTVVGNYRITEELGDGGTGTVYRSVDQITSRDVAIRRLRPEFAEDSGLVDSLAGISAELGRLNESRIATPVGVYRLDADVLVMAEFVEGESLAGVLRRVGRLPWRVAIDYLIQVLRALEQAHGVAVAHLGIRPSNLLLARSGRVKVIDFGLAHLALEQARSGGGRIGARLSHFSPEQFKGEPGDPRSDLYALASTLIELVSGRPPFVAEEFQALSAAVSSGAAPSLRGLVPGIPAWLEPVVLRGLANAAEDRFQTAAEFRAAVDVGLRSASHGTSRDPGVLVTVVEQGAPTRTADRRRQAATGALPSMVPPEPDGPGEAADDTVLVMEPSASGAARTAEPAGPAGTLLAAENTVFVGPGSSPAPVAEAHESPDPDRTVLLVPGAELPSPPVATAPPPASAEGATPTSSAVKRVAPKGPVWVRAVWVAVAIAALGAVTGVVLIRLGVLPGPWNPAASTPPAQAASAAAAEPVSSPAAPSAPVSAPAAVESSRPEGAGPSVATAPAPPPAKAAIQVTPSPKSAASKKAPAPLASRPLIEAAVPPPVPAETGPIRREEPPALPDRAFPNIKVVTQSGKSTRESDAILSLGAAELTLDPPRTGSPIRTILYRDVASIGYSQKQETGLFSKRTRHLLSIDAGGDMLVLRIDKGAVEQILSALEERTGVKASRPAEK